MNIYVSILANIIVCSLFTFYIPFKIYKLENNNFISARKVAFFIFLSSFSFYILFGNFSNLNKIYNDKQLLLYNKSKKIRPLLVRLKKQQLDMRIYLSEYPNDHIIWSNLGQSYFMVQNFKQSKFAFSQALKLKPRNEIYLMNLITSDANLEKGFLKKKDEYLLYMFILKNKKYTHALNLIALNLYQKNSYKNSLLFWEQILINMGNKQFKFLKKTEDEQGIKKNIKSIILNIEKRNKLEKILAPYE